MWSQRSIELFRSLPEVNRSCAAVYDGLAREGLQVSTCRIRNLLEVTILPELSYDDLVITARIIKLLVDVADCWSANPDKLQMDISTSIVAGLRYIPHHNEVDSLASALGRLLAHYATTHDYMEQIEHIESLARLRTCDEKDPFDP